MISDIINNTGITEVLDYGCGKGALGPSLQINHSAQMHLYDPGIPKLDKTPEPREMVVCTDVLEHVEPDLIENVLDDLKRVTRKYGFFDVCTVEAIQKLPDGRNAHLIIEPVDWWLPKIMERFSIKTVNVIDTGFWVVVEAKNEH